MIELVRESETKTNWQPFVFRFPWIDLTPKPAPVQATEFTECPHPTIAIRSRHALTSCVDVIARARIFEAAALTVRTARCSDVSPRASALDSQPGRKFASAKMMHGSRINVAPRRPAPLSTKHQRFFLREPRSIGRTQQCCCPDSKDILLRVHPA